jgi:hypothetical protein
MCNCGSVCVCACACVPVRARVCACACTCAIRQVEPDVEQLMRLMRSAVRYPGSAAKRGVQARLDVVARYSSSPPSAPFVFSV